MSTTIMQKIVHVDCLLSFNMIDTSKTANFFNSVHNFKNDLLAINFGGYEGFVEIHICPSNVSTVCCI